MFVESESFAESYLQVVFCIFEIGGWGQGTGVLVIVHVDCDLIKGKQLQIQFRWVFCRRLQRVLVNTHMFTIKLLNIVHWSQRLLVYKTNLLDIKDIGHWELVINQGLGPAVKCNWVVSLNRSFILRCSFDLCQSLLRHIFLDQGFYCTVFFL